MAKRRAILLVFSLLFVFQFFTVARALPPSAVGEPRPPGLPLCPDEPPAIPDSPFIESLTLKQQNNLLARVLVNEAFFSRLGSCNWNSKADLNFDGVVDIFDAIIVAKNL